MVMRYLSVAMRSLAETGSVALHNNLATEFVCLGLKTFAT